MRRAFATLVLSLAAIALGASCGGAQRPDAGPRGTVRFKAVPSDAVIEVDETLMGPASMFEKEGLLLKPGPHRVIFRREGFFPAYKLFDVREGGVAVVSAELRPVPE
ncbi:MAG: hypothetical protein PHU25_20630 [Deltaproteobacteria bacterium]|nr:hypothetical protein [Deltaproteobacteria bacterium]